VTAVVLDKLRAWQALENDPHLEADALSLVLYLAKKVYADYEPGGMTPFLLRLEKWLDNVPDEADQKLMISLLANVFFAGRGEFESLYRSALTGIYRWISDSIAVDLGDPALETHLDVQLEKTWICPVTDSLRINSFLKVNEISGHDHRPHWRSLATFGDVAKIQAYMQDNLIERLVLLEDFVGSGNQIKSTVKFVLDNFPSLKIAVCPLIICPTGHSTLSKLEKLHCNLTYLPTMVLPEEVFLMPSAMARENTTFTNGRGLVNKVSGKLSGNPFGYEQTGAMVVLFSNCPDNTLPLFRDETLVWNPLFPRVWRPE
jgi:hypothetical protein